MKLDFIERGNNIFILNPISKLKIKFVSAIDSLCGSWKDKRTADEIVKDIYNSRKNNEKENT